MLAKLGQREIAVIVIVITLLAAAAWYFTAHSNAQKKIQSLQADIQNLTIQRDRGLAARKALPQLEATIADYQKQIAEFLQELPPREEFASVLKSLSDRAKRSGVKVNSISRALAESPVENVRAINVSLALESPFPELFVYLKQLESMRRFSTIDGLAMTISKAEAKNPLLSTNLTMTVYVYEAPPPEGVASQGGAGGGSGQ